MKFTAMLTFTAMAATALADVAPPLDDTFVAIIGDTHLEDILALCATVD